MPAKIGPSVAPKSNPGMMPQSIAVPGRSGKMPTTLACHDKNQPTAKPITPPTHSPANIRLDELSGAGVHVATAEMTPSTAPTTVGTKVPKPMLISEEPSSCSALMWTAFGKRGREWTRGI